MSQLPPPTGSVSWFQPVASGAFVDDWFTDWKTPNQDDFRTAAQFELDQLMRHQVYPPNDGPLTEKQVEELYKDLDKHLPAGKLHSKRALF